MTRFVTVVTNQNTCALTYANALGTVARLTIDLLLLVCGAVGTLVTPHTALVATALEVIGKNALQKGQDVDDKRLRFDFSHFQKMTDEELRAVEQMVNDKIRQNIHLEDQGMVVQHAYFLDEWKTMTS